MSLNPTLRPPNRPEQTENEARIEALRKAIAVGVADIEAGRFRTFDATGPLLEHFSALAEEVLAGPSQDGSDAG